MGEREYAVAACAVVYAPNGRMAYWRASDGHMWTRRTSTAPLLWPPAGARQGPGKRLTGRGPQYGHPGRRRKGVSYVHTPGGTQQMTAQRVPDQWKGSTRIAPLRSTGKDKHRMPTPGVDEMGLNGTDLRPLGRNSAGGYPRRIFGPASPEFSGRRPPPF